jgi:hypothetical protein
MQDTNTLTIETEDQEEQKKKPKKVYNLVEKKITLQITNWLKKQAECWYYKVAGGGGFTSNGRLVMQRSGVPDLCVIYHGRTVWFEVKKPDGKLQPAQQLEIAKMIYAGAEVFVVRSLGEVKDILLGI